MKWKKNNVWKVKPIKMRFNLDTDRDGVPDWKDCRPFDYWRQHVDPGDWLDTEEPKPTLFNGEWMSTNRYKRKPKIYKPTRENIIRNAEKRYEEKGEYMDDLALYIAQVYLASLLGIKDRFTKELLSRAEISYYNEEILELFDKDTGVHHFVYVGDTQSNFPSLMLSITSEDMRTYGRRNAISLMQ